MSTRGSSGRTRADQDRSQDERDDIWEFKPSSMLEVPYSETHDYRWVAESVNGSPIPQRVQAMLREKWEFQSREGLPEDFLLYDPQDESGRVRYGGLILMVTPKKNKAARDAYYRRQSLERLGAANELQGIAGRDSVEEDRGTRTLSGADAARALANMSQS